MKELAKKTYWPGINNGQVLCDRCECEATRVEIPKHLPHMPIFYCDKCKSTDIITSTHGILDETPSIEKKK